jgi:glycosyltransferase involved in cell wall biosynthesis
VKLSLIVTTFERPDALACVLRSVGRQSHPPDELLIADDGSGAATRSLIESFHGRFTCPLIHCWQAHEGFRVCRARNLALSRAAGDYAVIVDGDMVMHPQFIADHRSCARPGSWVQGTRILLDERRTADLIAGGSPSISVYSSGIGGLRRLYAMRAPLLSGTLTRAANSFVATKSCNLAAWRVDLKRVNGFNEEMVGWGPEDKELAARLAYAGVRRRTLIFGGIAYHLDHPPAGRERRAANERILADTLAQRRVECAQGLRQHQHESR